MVRPVPPRRGGIFSLFTLHYSLKPDLRELQLPQHLSVALRAPPPLKGRLEMMQNPRAPLEGSWQAEGLTD